MEFKYNYVLFNSLDGKVWKDYPDGYYSICVEDLKRVEGIKVVLAPLDNCNKLVRIVSAAHLSTSLSKIVNVPLKKLWYPLFFKNDFKQIKPFCFIIIDRRIPISYLHYLRKKYNDCRVVLLHRDLHAVCERMSPELLTNTDLEMTYDKGESNKLNIPYFSEFESIIDVPIKNNPECDVYFAGKGKDRLSFLIDVYRKLSSYGLQCKYYLTGVPQEQQIQLPGIEYADHFMSYKEMLYHTVNSRYVLEINQGGADGYTSRFLEAVMYNKKLITNNSFIKQSQFYNPQYIHIINSAEDIQKSFFEYNGEVDYRYNGEFSPLRMIERVEEELIKKYGEPGR
jgi:hypothetical protein